MASNISHEMQGIDSRNRAGDAENVAKISGPDWNPEAHGAQRLVRRFLCLFNGGLRGAILRNRPDSVSYPVVPTPRSPPPFRLELGETVTRLTETNMRKDPKSSARAGGDSIYRANVRRIVRAAYDKHVIAKARHEAALREQRLEQARVDPGVWADSWDVTQSILQDMRRQGRCPLAGEGK